MDPEQLKLLGLSADATPAEVLARLADISDKAGKADDLETKLAEERSKSAAATNALSELRQDAEAKEKARVDAEIAKIDADAQATGLWANGDARCKLFHSLAATGLAVARDYVGTLKPVNPVGAPSQSRGTAPANQDSGSLAATLATDYGLSEVAADVVKDQFAQLGITQEMFAKHGPLAREDRERQPGYDWLNQGESEVH